MLMTSKKGRRILSSYLLFIEKPDFGAPHYGARWHMPPCPRATPLVTVLALEVSLSHSIKHKIETTQLGKRLSPKCPPPQILYIEVRIFYKCHGLLETPLE